MMKIFFLCLIGVVSAPLVDPTRANLTVCRHELYNQRGFVQTSSAKLTTCQEDLKQMWTQYNEELKANKWYVSRIAQLETKISDLYHILKEKEDQIDELKKEIINRPTESYVWKDVAIGVLAVYVFLHVLTIIIPWLIVRQIQFIQWVLGRLERIRRFFRVITFREPEYIELSMEAMVPGSTLEDIVEYPKCMIKIYAVDSKDDFKFTYIGSGFAAGDKIANFIWTACHVVAPYKKLRLVNANDPEKYLDVDKECFQSLDDLDVAILPYDKYAKQLAKLGLSKGKIPRLALSRKVVASIFGRGYVTHGTLEADVSGTVRYFGTTLKGFSGSPYIVNNTVLGVHVGCNTGHGVGYDMDFLNAVLKRKREDSYDRILEEMERFAKRGGRIKYSEYGMDDIQVMWDGRHHILDRDFMKQHFEMFSQVEHPSMLGLENWDAAELKEVQKDVVQVVVKEPEVKPQESKNLITTSAQVHAQPSMNEIVMVSAEVNGKLNYVDPPKVKKPQPTKRQMTFSQAQTQTDMDGHLLILARLDALSESISKLQKKPVRKTGSTKSKTPKLPNLR
nr:MAG: VP1 protein [Solemoviridae sp. 5]